MGIKSTVNYKGFDFDFEYNFSAGTIGTWEYPEEYPEWEIYNITLNGIDASELLESKIEDFEQEAINNLI